ncbi:nitrate reductase molybdenum cofactor assembly chaperone [Thiomonas sp. FB-6]|uniref:nitrate reductase molybdenum cofactor assembly chaperone n=1 Tax=Thiomonas sp. FB-6 TaxID=1158291 RepID=UPI00035DE2A0|nr:nitrate reductase molybdenum cofactor assembly chaperone [Thiomonas sp. FB-6]
MDATTLQRRLRAFALLFDYPGEALQRHAGEIAAELEGLGAARAAPSGMGDLLRHLCDADLLELQAEYVDVFDRGRSTSLNLFEHVHGDARERGQAMVDLLGQYREAGLELHSRELPDYLPVYLEYCSLLEPQASLDALGEIAPLLVNLAAALERRESPWLAAAAALCALAGERDWRASARRAAEAARAAQARSPTPGPRDAAGEGQGADWSAAALDAAWAEEPVSFLGACSPQGTAGAVQAVQFHPRAAQARASGA